MSRFMEDNSLLEDYFAKSGSLITAGGFNFISSDVSTTNFIILLEVSNLRLHATQETHRAGNVLDLIIDRNDDEDFVHSVDDHDSMISDDVILMFHLILQGRVMRGELSRAVTLNRSILTRFKRVLKNLHC